MLDKKTGRRINYPIIDIKQAGYNQVLPFFAKFLEINETSEPIHHLDGRMELVVAANAILLELGNRSYGIRCVKSI